MGGRPCHVADGEHDTRARPATSSGCAGISGSTRWLVLGGSWGSTLGLAYAQRHPEHVRALVLFSVVTTTRREVEWVTRSVGRFHPLEWERFRDGVPAEDRDGSLVDAYARLLADPAPAVRAQRGARLVRVGGRARAPAAR